MGRREQAGQLLIERARRLAGDRCVTVDYYRIRRQVAYPLPLRADRACGLALDFAGDYPWDTWLSWAVEERVWALGEGGELANNGVWRELAEADLASLAGWTRWRAGSPDGLPVGHFVRTMTTTATRWGWLGEATRAAVRAACHDLVERYREFLDGERTAWAGRRAEPDGEAARRPLGNIHFIGTVGLCLAARYAGHPLGPWLEEHTGQFAEAIWAQRQAGITEAVCYDGYVLDFALDWAAGAPPAWRQRLLAHPVTAQVLAQSAAMGAPGRLHEVARLGDVEPFEMPFHLGAHAKVRSLMKSPASDWLLARIEPGWLRSDALAHLARAVEPASSAPPGTGGMTWAAMVCRTGWEAGDRAVAMAAHGEMGHLHLDNGSLTIAAGGHWLLDDPGYQQYLKTREREFTIGAAAHNCPRLDGRSQSRKEGRRLLEPVRRDGAWQMAMDLAACYEPAPAVCRRECWLLDDGTVLVRDTIAADGLGEVGWHWHGHPRAAWWAEDGLALICLEGVELWVRCVGVELRQGQIERQRGSRGHLTLGVALPAAGSIQAWWCFGARDRVAAVQVEAGCASLDGRRFGAPAGQAG